MSEHRWVRVTACDNIPPREGRTARVGDCELAIFNLGDRFFTIDNRCPHQGGPLCDGIVTGASVVCPLHAWKVDLDTGLVQRPAASSGCVQTYATDVSFMVWVLLGPLAPFFREQFGVTATQQGLMQSAEFHRLLRHASTSRTQGHQIDFHASIPAADLEHDRVSPGSKCGRTRLVRHEYIPTVGAVASITILK